MGAVRTTFAMVAASLVRRKQMIDRGLPDPYALKAINNAIPISSTPGSPSTASIFHLMCSIVNFLFQIISQRIWLGFTPIFIRHHTVLIPVFLLTLANREPDFPIPRTSKHSTRAQQIITPTNISAATMYS